MRLTTRISVILSSAVLAAAIPMALVQAAVPAPGAAQPGAAPDGPGAPGGRGAGGGRGLGGGAGGGFGGGGGRGGRGVAGPLTRPADLDFYNPALPLEKRLDDLVSRLNIEEKIAQLQMATPAIPRLGIYAYDWWNEALHGVGRNGTATVFPQAIGMAAAWDAALHKDMANVIGVEARAKHAAAVAVFNHARYSGIDLWSPNINIFRDPRWGRGMETYGEDPYLTSRLAISFVTGLQGNDPFYFQTIATPKHFAVHSGPEPLRHKFDAVITDEDLFSTYLPAFEAAIREGKAFSIMSSYNALDGVPNSANGRLLTDILRKQWGFQGYVVSDVDSVGDIFQANSHAYVPAGMDARPSAALASALALKAGNDLNSGTTFGGPNGLQASLANNLITEKEIDINLRRLLTARFRLGEFDPEGYAKNPYNKITPADNDTPQHDAIALTMARESMTLLKNANHTLPFKKDIGTIAVIGPNANALPMQLANYNGTPSKPVTILQGIVNIVGADHVITGTGSPLLTDRVALTEPVKTDYLYTDASKTKHGLTAVYAANANSFNTPLRTEVTETASLSLPDPAAPNAIPYDPTLAVKWTGVIAPPVTGDYHLGAKGRDGFRISINDKVILDEMQQGQLRVLGNSVHMEKDKLYNVTIEYVHAPAAGRGGRGGAAGRAGPGGRGGAPGGGPGRGAPGGGGPGAPGGTPPAGAPGASAPALDELLFPVAAGGRGPGAGAPGAPGAVGPDGFTPVAPAAGPGGGAGGRGGRGGGRGGPPFGSTTDAPGIIANAQTDADTLFQLVWTRATADGAPADTAGKNLYAESVALAERADAVVLVVGIDATLELEEQQTHYIGFQGGDRTAIELPAVQENLIKQVTKAAAGRPVVVVLTNGSAMAVNWANENVPAILEAWYPGQHGDAVADVLFGNYNPAGRLPITFYKATEDLPEFTDYSMANRTYRYFNKPVLYPFGYGLSYSTFEYSNVTAPARSQTGDDVKVSVNVKNTSTIAGDEVVECYLNRDVPPVNGPIPAVSKITPEQAAQLSTPRKQLVGFARVPLKAGEQKNVTFTITTQQLSLVVGDNDKRMVNPGNLQIQIGGSSASGVTTPLVLEGAPKAPEYHFVEPVIK